MRAKSANTKRTRWDVTQVPVIAKHMDFRPKENEPDSKPIRPCVPAAPVTRQLQTGNRRSSPFDIQHSPFVIRAVPRCDTRKKTYSQNEPI